MSEETAKKLALEVRAVSDSDKSVDFDLAGYGGESARKLVASAFATPLPLKSMVRLSFVCGGGKKVRQKYHDGLVTSMCDALKGIGYLEDKGAALTLDSAGSYKYQHDTGKDLIFVHVYPKVDPSAAGSPDEGASVDAMSPSQLLLFSELPVFQRMVTAKTLSFAQRRRVLDILKKAKADYAAIEAKLAAIEALTEQEQQVYDELDVEALAEKQTWLTGQMDGMITSGQLTKAEQATVLEQLNAKLEAVELHIATADSEGKDKRAAKLREGHAEVVARIESVNGAKPLVRRPKFEQEIKVAKKQIADLAKLEARSKKEVLPLSEIEKLNKMPKLVADLAEMEKDSKGWLAD